MMEDGHGRFFSDGTIHAFTSPCPSCTLATWASEFISATGCVLLPNEIQWLWETRHNTRYLQDHSRWTFQMHLVSKKDSQFLHRIFLLRCTWKTLRSSSPGGISAPPFFGSARFGQAETLPCRGELRTAGEPVRQPVRRFGGTWVQKDRCGRSWEPSELHGARLQQLRVQSTSCCTSWHRASALSGCAVSTASCTRPTNQQLWSHCWKAQCVHLGQA